VARSAGSSGVSPDSSFLARAAELAERGRLRVEPNPVVGCVLVRGNRIVGEGWHARFGEAHAERAAIADAGTAAKGATAYVTLEPCDHEGRTPACSAALIRAGVREVVYAHADPNPKTAGLGPKRLRAAGIRVRKARATATIRDQLAPYLAHLDRERPWVIAKWAMTLDGRIATRTGDSMWITQSDTRDWSHAEFRGGVDAIVAGAGTLRADDPLLTNRSGIGGQPLRVIVAGSKKLPRSAKIFEAPNTLIAHPKGFRAPDGVESIVCGKKGRVSPRKLLRALHQRGLGRILLEGGPTLVAAFLKERLVDQAVVFVAPKIIGGAGAPGPIAGKGIATMGDALALTHVESGSVGSDLVIEGLLAT